MERTVLKLSPENFVSIAILSAAAYLGIVGVKLAIDKLSGMTGAKS